MTILALGIEGSANKIGVGKTMKFIKYNWDLYIYY
jgi:hypothetical protein